MAARLPFFRKIERMLLTFLAVLCLTTVFIGFSIDSVLHNNSDLLTLPYQVTNQTSVRQSSEMNSLWSASNNIPAWMKDYFDYHANAVQNIDFENWKEHKYLVLTCYRVDEKCGGLSDRLKPIPLLVLAAQRSQRILFIDWDRPYPLEDFLIPPEGGFQWKIPSFLKPILQSHPSTLITRASLLVKRCQDNSTLQMHTHMQDFRGGETQYDEIYGEGSFRMVYHDLFRIFFKPVPNIRLILDQYLVKGSTSKHLNAHLLVEGTYNVAHLRAEYGKEIERHPILSKPEFLEKAATNAILCASELQISAVEHIIPIYFASDNPIALATARQIAANTELPIITFNRSEEKPLHLDYYDNETQPSSYYSTFVDLFLSGSGKCVSHGRGGFGRLAVLLSFNATCNSKHVKNFLPEKCVGDPLFRLDAGT